jgi:hypothetical protein
MICFIFVRRLIYSYRRSTAPAAPPASSSWLPQRAVIFAPLQKNGIAFFYKDNQNKRKKTITLKVDSEL